MNRHNHSVSLKKLTWSVITRKKEKINTHEILLSSFALCRTYCYQLLFIFFNPNFITLLFIICAEVCHSLAIYITLHCTANPIMNA